MGCSARLGVSTQSLGRRVPGAVILPAGYGKELQDPLAYKLFTRPGQEGSWSARGLVQQEAGMPTGPLETSIGDALAILRSYAFATDTQLTDVARNVLDRKLDLSGY